MQQDRDGTVSEVVRAGLRLLEEQEAKLMALRAVLAESERSGPAAASDSGPSVAPERPGQPGSE